MEITHAAVVGLGTMGAGIAEVLARCGLDVVALEATEDLLAAGRSRIEGSLDRARDRGRLDPDAHAAVRARVRYATDLGAAADADLVAEAVPERLEVKTAVFAALDEHCGEHTVFATNTSSLPVTAIAAATSRPTRVVGMHFFNPAPVMRLVEVVRTVLVDDDVVAGVCRLAAAAGKTPVVVGDRAGFIANALLLPYLNHAAALVETGRGSVAEIDAAVRERTGLPMGPLTLMDLIGLDVCLPILDVLWEEFRDRRYAATPLLRRLTTAGRLGRKTGQGWYSYGPGEPAPAVGPTETGGFDPAELVAAHVADAERMVADAYASAADVDTAMRLGCGYPDGIFALAAAERP